MGQQALTDAKDSLSSSASMAAALSAAATASARFAPRAFSRNRWSRHATNTTCSARVPWRLPIFIATDRCIRVARACCADWAESSLRLVSASWASCTRSIAAWAWSACSCSPPLALVEASSDSIADSWCV